MKKIVWFNLELLDYGKQLSNGLSYKDMEHVSIHKPLIPDFVFHIIFPQNIK